MVAAQSEKRRWAIDRLANSAPLADHEAEGIFLAFGFLEDAKVNASWYRHPRWDVGEFVLADSVHILTGRQRDIIKAMVQRVLVLEHLHESP